MLEEPSPPTSVTLLSPAEILAKLREFVTIYETRGRDALNRNPLESLVGLVTAGAAVYYAAERGRNDKVNTYWDALEFVSTCASVGYSNIFPNTPAGKMVASVLFLLGPNLAERALDPPAATAQDGSASAAVAPSDAALLSKLDELLVELRKLNAKEVD
ncbi:MAG: ion channel [Pirellulales bacterium]